MRSRVLLIVFLTFLALAIIVFRTSRQRLKLYCEEDLRDVVVNILREERMKYEFSEREKAVLIVEKSKITYKGMVYNLTWEERLSKRIEEILSVYFKGARIEALSSGFLSRRYRVIFQDSIRVVEVKIAGRDILSDVIKSILHERADYFENGFILAPIEAIMEGKRIFFYDPRTEQVLFEDAGGS
ncbi:MAG: hypothetical protein PWQ90_1339 [Pseudothermotoga sp.]|nr:hypothetical protein [Pseudothermotoga sp.]